MALNETDKRTIAEIVATAIVAAQAPAQAPAASTPATGRVASPFAVISTADTSDSRPDVIRNQPSQRDARSAASYYAVPGFSCNVGTITRNGPDGAKSGLGHGFAYARKSGDACPTNGCTGTIL